MHHSVHFTSRPPPRVSKHHMHSCSQTQERLAAFRARAADADTVAANAKKKHSNVDVAEQREKARLRAKQFAKLQKNEIKDQKKKQLENKLRKLCVRHSTLLACTDLLTSLSWCSRKLRKERIEQREQHRAQIYAINAIMMRWNQNQMQASWFAFVNMVIAMSNPLPIFTLKYQKFDKAKTAKASKTIPEPDETSKAILEADETIKAILEADETSKAILEADEASVVITETDEAIPETDEAIPETDEAIPETDETNKVIPKTDETIPETDEASKVIPETDEAIPKIDEASKVIRETDESGNTIAKTAGVSESESKASDDVD